MALSDIILLDFKLHHFCRISWTSQKAREMWEPRFQQIRQMLGELKRHMLAEGLLGFDLQYIPLHERKALRNAVSPYGLIVRAIQSPPSALAPFLHHLPEEESINIFVLIGRKANVLAAQTAIREGDVAAFHQARGIPSCCTQSMLLRHQHRLFDPNWASLTSELAQDATPRTLQTTGNLLTHTLLHPLGLRLLPYTPCSPNCSHSIQRSQDLLSLARSQGYSSPSDWLIQILSWPLSWSALHGIAETKLPILKYSSPTDPTAHKYTLHQSGSAYPDLGERGLSFPYKRPPKLYFSETKAFKKGLEQDIEG